jgi:hypothetical protein
MFAQLNTLHTSNARQAAAAEFERVHTQAQAMRWLTGLFGRKTRLADLPRRRANRRAGRPTWVPLSAIIGSLDRSQDFDRAWRPLLLSSRDRWINVAVAMASGRDLPPVELIHTRDGYYVSDGHHRISVARALGEDLIEANVIEQS